MVEICINCIYRKNCAKFLSRTASIYKCDNFITSQEVEEILKKAIFEPFEKEMKRIDDLSKKE